MNVINIYIEGILIKLTCVTLRSDSFEHFESDVVGLFCFLECFYKGNITADGHPEVLFVERP